MYGICDNDHWGLAPIEFKETKHFLVCGLCGCRMYLQRSDPYEAGYSDKYKVEVKIENQ